MPLSLNRRHEYKPSGLTDHKIHFPITDLLALIHYRAMLVNTTPFLSGLRRSGFLSRFWPFFWQRKQVYRLSPAFWSVRMDR